MVGFLQNSPEDIATAANLLTSGAVVALPTETVYGLAAHAFDENAVRAVFTIKGRPLIDPLIIHVAHREQVERIAYTDNPILDTLAQAFWPGPLTVVLNKKSCVPDLVTAGRNTVAVRIPKHPLAHAILKACDIPIAAPSANPFGYVSPTLPEHVADSLGSKVQYIVDGGPCDNGIESTIIDLSQDHPTILRPGPITQQQLEDKTGITFNTINKQQTVAASRGEIAPGSLYKHYSPTAKLILLDDALMDASHSAKPDTAYVSLARTPRYPELASNCKHYWLSETPDNLAEIGRNTFSMLRKLDKAGIKTILFEKPPQQNLGVAINDRLRRAAAE